MRYRARFAQGRPPGTWLRNTAIVPFALLLAACAGGAPPSWVPWHDSSCSADFGADGRQEQVVLSSHKVSILDSAGEVLCTTPDGWQVMDAQILENTDELCVLDLHEPQELILLAWRRENFGSSKPFWHDESKDPSWSQHLFVLDVCEEGLRELWMSSNIGAEVYEMEVEGTGKLALTERDGNVTHWQRSTWGFELI